MWASLAVFVAVTSFMATRHVMWRDEVRAFSVATKTTTWGELIREIHVEGHPILWYALLRIGYGLTDSRLVLPVAALIIATAAAYLILRYAPFPVWARVLIVFGAFLGHEYSVMARNYGLGALLMVCACIAFGSRRERPLLLGACLALLANTSVHAALASVVLGLVWVISAFDRSDAPRSRLPLVAAGIAVGIAGVAFALLSSRPPADMSYAHSLAQLTPARAFSSILVDPGLGLTNIAAGLEIPWARLGLPPDLVSRILVDLGLLTVAWAVIRNRAVLLGLLVGILGFEVMFGAVYLASLRHHGIVFFLVVSLCWIAASDARRGATGIDGRRIALAMLPLLFTQSLALPLIARRQLTMPGSSTKAFASFIQSAPSLREAIIVGEPDYFVEGMPYYVENPLYFARMHEFGHRVYFDYGRKRRFHLTLGELIAVGDSLAAAHCKPVLLAIGYPKFVRDPAGKEYLSYRGPTFQWTPAERAQLLQRGRLLKIFSGSITSEDFQVYEIPPRTVSGQCILSRQ